MNEKQDGVAAIGATNIDDLAGAADRRGESLVDAVGRDDPVDIGDDRAARDIGVGWRRRGRLAGARDQKRRQRGGYPKEHRLSFHPPTATLYK